MTTTPLNISKRYWLFNYLTYYPCGGMNDFEGSFDSIEEAQAAIKSNYWESDHNGILDSQTGIIHYDHTIKH